MRYLHLAVQASVVLTMVSFVSYPQYRPAARTQPRAGAVWHYVPEAVVEARANDAARFAGNPALMQRPIRPVEQTAPVINPVPTQARSYYTTPAVAAAGAKINALLGVAKTSLNAPIPYARVVLRNLRTGRALAETVADDEGQFSFVDVEATAYIVELLGPDGSVVAASPLVTLSPGDVRKLEIRAASTAQTVAASLSNTMTSTLPQMTAAAAGNDVTRTTSAMTPQESSR